jgi:hypothetical protein
MVVAMQLSAFIEKKGLPESIETKCKIFNQ